MSNDTSSGLLSKMVRFVRNPATSWSELDSVQTDRDDAVSKQLLKEMIERKRRNDFVRKREFDMLRKMRKHEAMVGMGQDISGGPSFFQSSMASRPDDRASTLKKIDEIEAQMSMQWWKTKDQNALAQADVSRSQGRGEVTLNPMLDNALPMAYRPTSPAELPLSSRAGESAAPAAQRRLSENRPAAPLQFPRIDGASSFEGLGDRPESKFSPSRSAVVGVHEMLAHDAELEEAAILFANGEDTGTEAGLLQILAPGASRESHVETWLTLFDFYRATGEQDKFEKAAIEFVERFDRSAPQWFSLPDMVKKLGGAADKATEGAPAHWICPSVLGMQTVAALRAAIARSAMPWRLDWSNLKSIESPALDPLFRVFASWASQPVQLRFMGDSQLQQVLRNATPSGDRNTDKNWWLLRMEALRITHRPDDFELTALDFCVTYEVSPPAWESARCEYKTLDEQGSSMGANTIIGEVYRDSMPSGFHASPRDAERGADSSQSNQLLSVELAGQIQGDAIAVLDQLETKLAGADVMHISCAKLIRVDFSAAGTLLNWVSARQAEGRSVQFLEVNRLVASFFNVIGITEHARVLVRCD
ncbi:MAG: STAS domain-containing protein [Polaromonas sp.]